jgi:hypothetical protein
MYVILFLSGLFLGGVFGLVLMAVISCDKRNSDES